MSAAFFFKSCHSLSGMSVKNPKDSCSANAKVALRDCGWRLKDDEGGFQKKGWKICKATTKHGIPRSQYLRDGALECVVLLPLIIMLTVSVWSTWEVGSLRSNRPCSRRSTTARHTERMTIWNFCQHHKIGIEEVDHHHHRRHVACHKSFGQPMVWRFLPETYFWMVVRATWQFWRFFDFSS